jgi:hypothetical protein
MLNLAAGYSCSELSIYGIGSFDIEDSTASWRVSLSHEDRCAKAMGKIKYTSVHLVRAFTLVEILFPNKIADDFCNARYF